MGIGRIVEGEYRAVEVKQPSYQTTIGIGLIAPILFGIVIGSIFAHHWGLVHIQYFGGLMSLLLWTLVALPVTAYLIWVRWRWGLKYSHDEETKLMLAICGNGLISVLWLVVLYGIFRHGIDL